MHMTSAPHLLNEDRPDFERILDEPCASFWTRKVREARDSRTHRKQRPGAECRAVAHHCAGRRRPDRRAGGRRVRRVPQDPRRDARGCARGGALPRQPGVRLRRHGRRGRGGSGAGLGAVIAVLTPLLAGAAALIFLLIGYSVDAVHPQPAIASPLRTAGWFFAAVTAASILLGGIGLLLTALRDGSTAIHDSPDGMPPEVARAREAWRQALLERGLLPFLDDALNGTAAPVAPRPGPVRPADPAAGYSQPGLLLPAGPAADRTALHQPRLHQPGLRRTRPPPE